MFIAIEMEELDVLRGLDHTITALYLYFKQHMDYETAVIGRKRRISYQSISEALYIEPRAGVKGQTFSKQTIRGLIGQLEKHGLVAKLSAETLIFKLPLVQTPKNVQKKANRGSYHQANTHEALLEAEFNERANRGESEKANTPHLSPNKLITTTTTKLHSTDQENAVSGGGCENLIFHKTLDADTVKSIKKLIQPFNAEMQQELLDELHGYLDLKKIQSTPIALMRGFVERAKVGAFDPNHAIKVRNARNNRAQEAQHIETQRKPVKRDVEKAQANISNIRDILKSKKAV